MLDIKGSTAKLATILQVVSNISIVQHNLSFIISYDWITGRLVPVLRSSSGPLQIVIKSR
jgi:hypothetical protein